MLFLIVFTLLLSAFFSGSEIAFVSANKLGVEVKRNKGGRRGKLMSRFYDDPKSFLGTMLVGNNIALVLFTTLVTELLKPGLSALIGEGFAFLLLSTILITVVILLFGEFIPKTMFRLYSNELIFALTYPLVFFKFLLIIPSWIMTTITNFILKFIIRVPEEEVSKALTRIDLESFIQQNIYEENEEIETDMFKNALNLRQVKLRDCMVPRNEIVYLEKKAKPQEALNAFIQSSHSRLIIVDRDIENVVGYIHHQQLLDNPKNLKSIILDIMYVPEAMSAQDMMSKFINSDTNIACVVDEFGGTAGIITLEDILEEIVGEIEDEHDLEEYVEEQINHNEFRFSGRLEVDYLNDKYDNINIPEGEYHTLSGYLVMTSGNIPEEGAEISQDGFLLILEQVSDTKIEIIRMIIEDENTQD